MIRYDSLLVRELVRELRDRLAGRRASALRFDREHHAVALRAGRVTLAWELAPDGGGVRWIEASDRWSGNVALPRQAIISDVAAPADDRVIRIAFEPESRVDSGEEGGARALVIELIGPTANAVAINRDDRIGAVLRPREGGARPLMPGAEYRPPAARHRLGASAHLSIAEWRELLSAIPPEDRARALLANVAYTSPLNVAHILGDAAFASDESLLNDAYERWRMLVEPTSRTPCILHTPRGLQPYPFALSGSRCVPELSLLAGFNAISHEHAPPEPKAMPMAAALARLRHRSERLGTRIARLETELEGAAADADTLRHHADLLLSQLQRVQKGAHEAELDDYAGGSVRLDLDPALAPTDNARRLYDAARKRQRAAERLPTLIERAERELERLRALIQRIERGEATAEEIGVEAARGGRKPTKDEQRRPYRRYRTSGGLEVRVGRGAASNDELTLHHSHPEDIWLHARDVGGAHVVLRWADRVANPPAIDLTEAAVLAALHSRARTSGTVPVDWTRRKYVRKPRKAKPGLVLVERAKTLFVQPDPALERRLRADADEDLT